MSEIENWLQPESLTDNYNQWIKSLMPGEAPTFELKHILANMHTTHTFGQEESRRRKPFIDILFKNQALLSQVYRNRGGMYYKDEQLASLGQGTMLANYVFAYLGIHQHYYAMNKSKTLQVPAFGVFLPASLENSALANATRRDLSSTESVPDKALEFMQPADARQYAAYEIVNKYGSDFWHYWGNLDKIWHDANYCNTNWAWKVEMHYAEKVPISSFDAIIWPLQKIVGRNGDTFDDPKMLEYIGQFKQQNSTIRVYTYEWNAQFATLCLSTASYIVSKHYYDYLEYIPNEQFDAAYKKSMEELSYG